MQPKRQEPQNRDKMYYQPTRNCTDRITGSKYSICTSQGEFGYESVIRNDEGVVVAIALRSTLLGAERAALKQARSSRFNFFPYSA